MKNLKFLSYISAVLLLVACEKEPKNYVEFSGKVENLAENADSVHVFIQNGFEKSFPINEDGTFSDTLNVTEGKYQFKIGDEYGTIYLKNNDQIHVTTDYKDFDNQLAFTGTGSSLEKTKVHTDFLKLMMANFNEETLSLEKDAFGQKIESFKADYAALKKNNNNIGADFWKDTDNEVEQAIKGFEQYYFQKIQLKEKFTGQPLPTFAMENIEGKTVKLEDFKGKYVYIDVWATWCGPCKREIPALKELEKEYHDKNIEFVSMSIDETKDKEKWSKFVEKEALGGVQIFAENAWKSDFVQAMEIKGIPRFILVDPAGVIVDPDAPRPSDDNLKKLFTELQI